MFAQPFWTECAVSASCERHSAALLERVDYEYGSRAGTLQEQGHEEADDALAEDQGHLAESHGRIVDDVQGGLEVGGENTKFGVEVVGKAHGHPRWHDEDLLVRMGDEDGISRR